MTVVDATQFVSVATFAAPIDAYPRHFQIDCIAPLKKVDESVNRQTPTFDLLPARTTHRTGYIA
jgi:hypothetical protein